MRAPALNFGSDFRSATVVLGAAVFISTVHLVRAISTECRDHTKKTTQSNKEQKPAIHVPPTGMLHRQKFQSVNNLVHFQRKGVGLVKGEVKAKIKISPVVVFGVLSRMVLVRES